MKVIVTLLFILASFNLSAEYRAYQYIVKNKISTAPDQPNSNIVISTLNPRAYMAYNGGSNLINVNILRTWICPGDTSAFKDICESPYGRLPAEVLQ